MCVYAGCINEVQPSELQLYPSDGDLNEKYKHFLWLCGVMFLLELTTISLNVLFLAECAVYDYFT